MLQHLRLILEEDAERVEVTLHRPVHDLSIVGGQGLEGEEAAAYLSRLQAVHPVENLIDVMGRGRQGHQAPQGTPRIPLKATKVLELGPQIGGRGLRHPAEPVRAQLEACVLLGGVEGQPGDQQQFVHRTAVHLDRQAAMGPGEVSHHGAGFGVIGVYFKNFV